MPGCEAFIKFGVFSPLLELSDSMSPPARHFLPPAAGAGVRWPRWQAGTIRADERKTVFGLAVPRYTTGMSIRPHCRCIVKEKKDV